MRSVKYVMLSLFAVVATGVCVMALRPGMVEGFKRDVGLEGGFFFITLFQIIYAIFALPGPIAALRFAPKQGRRLPEIVFAALVVSFGANIGMDFVIEGTRDIVESMPWIAGLALIAFTVAAHAGALFRNRCSTRA